MEQYDLSFITLLTLWPHMYLRHTIYIVHNGQQVKAATKHGYICETSRRA